MRRLTPCSSCWNSTTSRENNVRTLAKRAKPRYSTASTCGWMKALRRDQPNSSVIGWISAKQRPLGVRKRMACQGVVCGSTCSTRPMACTVRSDSSSMPMARG
ncbi:hypothetical protein D9M71_548710 [compost metagenome]